MKALLIIDIQNDYFKGGANPLSGSKEASETAGRILQFARKEKMRIIHVQHISRGSDFFIEGSKGVEIHSNVAPIAGEKIFIKHFPNSFRETGLKEYLDSIHVNKLLVCGMMTHMCIDSTVRAAKDLGYEVELIEDACATKELELNKKRVSANFVQISILAALNKSFAKIVKAEQILGKND